MTVTSFPLFVIFTAAVADNYFIKALPVSLPCLSCEIQHVISNIIMHRTFRRSKFNLGISQHFKRQGHQRLVTLGNGVLLFIDY
jgi:hypothetical protein